MLESIRQQFNAQTYQKALVLFDIDPQKITQLNAFESDVYTYSKAGKDYILKITHTIRRSVGYIMGELEYVNYLVQNGVRTSLAIPSINGRLVEVIPILNSTDSWLVYAFEKAPGKRINKTTFSADVLYHLGKETGKMHRLSRQYKPSQLAYKRQEWHEDEIWQLADKIPENDAFVIAPTQKLLQKMRAVPQTPQNYGLIHGDLHHGNFFWTGQQLWTFDFDDSEYHYFANDSAISLYYLVNSKDIRQQQTASDFAAFYWEHYLRGYETEAHFETEWFAYIDVFLHLRNVLLYAVFMDSDAVGIPPSRIRLLRSSLTIVEHGTPYLKWLDKQLAAS